MGSYDAEPPRKQAIDRLFAIIRRLADSGILPKAVVPSAEGGVAAYFKSDDPDRIAYTAYIESPNEGLPLLVTYSRTGGSCVSEIGPDVHETDLGIKIGEHLDAL